MIRKPDTSGGFTPSLMLDDSVQSPTRQCYRLDGKLDAAHLSPTIHNFILGMARVRNVVSSLLIENESIDFSTARDLLETETPTTKSEEMTLRFLKYYLKIHDTQAELLPEPTPENLMALHQELFQDLEGYNAGKLKSEQNGILDLNTGQFSFACTPPDRTLIELEHLYKWYQTTSTSSTELAVIGTWFAEFEAIHPFDDGNGRLGRMFVLILLKKLGFSNAPLVPLDARFYKLRANYYEKLAATNNGKNYQVWNRFFAKQLEHAYLQAGKMADFKPLLDAIASKPKKATLLWILSQGGNWFSRGDIPNLEDYSPISLTKALAELTAEGVLEPRGDKKGRKYRLHTKFLEQTFAGINFESTDP